MNTKSKETETSKCFTHLEVELNLCLTLILNALLIVIVLKWERYNKFIWIKLILKFFHLKKNSVKTAIKFQLEIFINLKRIYYVRGVMNLITNGRRNITDR